MRHSCSSNESRINTDRHNIGPREYRQARIYIHWPATRKSAESKLWTDMRRNAASSVCRRVLACHFRLVEEILHVY